jgi:hypothetical protein
VIDSAYDRTDHPVPLLLHSTKIPCQLDCNFPSACPCKLILVPCDCQSSHAGIENEKQRESAYYTSQNFKPIATLEVPFLAGHEIPKGPRPQLSGASLTYGYRRLSIKRGPEISEMGIASKSVLWSSAFEHSAYVGRQRFHWSTS